MLELKHDPLQIFKDSQTPVGIYARHYWLHEHDQHWQRDHDIAARHLYSNQWADGSWENSSIWTISRLFGLHLCVRELDEQSERGLNWLISHHLESEHRAGKVGADELAGLPFVKSDNRTLYLTASLFLATIFGLGGDTRVMAAYNGLAAEGVAAWIPPANFSNILRCFVVHPDFVSGPEVKEAVHGLAAIQQDDGRWPELNFYQTFNVLGHISGSSAEKQLQQAAVYLTEHQNRDGSWGRTHPEWNTFLIVHALKRKGLI